MESKTINYALVGGFVSTMLIALFVIVALLAGRTGATDAYFVVFENVAGLKFGSQVTFEGFPIGQIEEISPTQQDGQVAFRVDLSVREGWDIPTDSRATISSPGILSALAIDIVAGQSTQMAAPGSQLETGAAGDLFGALSSVAGDVSNLTNDGLLPLIARIDGYIEILGDALADRAPEILDNLTAISAELNAQTPTLVGDIQAVVETAQQVADDLDTAGDGMVRLTTGQTATDIEVTAANVRAASVETLRLIEGLSETQTEVDALITQIDALVANNRENVDDSLADMRFTLATISRNIDTITRNLDGTSRNMLEFTRQIRQNPSLLLGGGRPAEQ